jgi:hypothetical protein
MPERHRMSGAASSTDPLPPSAAWRHVVSRSGFEVVFIRENDDGVEFEGSTCAVEAEQSWQIDYHLRVDRAGVTRSAQVTSRFPGGRSELQLELPADGDWLADGAPVPLLTGCVDVDLESSALTNAFPVRRLSLRPGESAEVPAVYVRAPELQLEVLEQRYTRAAAARPASYRYAAPRFAFAATLEYDQAGLVTDYPGIAKREL